MPILSYDDDEEEIIVPVKSPVDMMATSPVYQNNNSVSTPLILDVDGEPWEVEYYHQKLTSSERPKALDIGLDPTLQQYTHIMAFRLSVTEELSTNNEAELGTVSVTGSGVVYPETIIPHIGDMFIGKMETGFLGLFTLTAVTRTSLYKRSAYQVEYRLFDQLNNALKADLDAKVIEDKYFDKYRLLAGTPPLVSYATINREVMYKQSLRRCIDQLYENYYDDRCKTFTVQDDVLTFSDPWATAFFNALIDSKLRDGRPMPVEYNFGVDHVLDKPTLWRAILRSDPNGLAYIYPRHYTRVYTANIGIAYIQRSITHTKIDWIPIPDKWAGGAVDINEEAYVLSHAFYDNDAINQTKMEKAIHTLLRKEQVLDRYIDEFIDIVPTIADKKQAFYYMMLVIAILVIRLHEG